MSTIRLVWRDLVVARLWGAWTRSYIVNSVVKRCRREKSVREVFQRVRQALLRPRRTFLLSATAAFKTREDNDEPPPSCEQSISDEDLEALMSELEEVEALSRRTLFCGSCGKRRAGGRGQPAGRYCACKDPQPLETAPDGWVPYMEAEDVVIWRKEYKPGQGLFAYKVYGRYKDVRAADFAAVQVDSAYRLVWDAAVASLSVVERSANGVGDQAVLHWEVLWPRLFANRDYVYIRRHKEFDVRSSAAREGVFPASEGAESRPPERASVHSRAKRRAQEMDARERQRGPARDNKAFIIVSRSCTHPGVPETKHAIRVNEYWSHMVVRSINGADEPGMEFVLTYYDEPGVGGMPVGVATWATGRAAPAYLARMRRAAAGYAAWAHARDDRELPDFLPYGPAEAGQETRQISVSEQDMESSKHGPDLENGSESSRYQEVEPDQRQTVTNAPSQTIDTHKIEETAKDTIQKEPEVEKTSSADNIQHKEPHSEETEVEKCDDEENPGNGSWWRYLYPFYYFV